MDYWAGNNEWLEISRIIAPVVAAIIAGTVAVLISRKNVEAILRASQLDIEASTKASLLAAETAISSGRESAEAASRRDSESWRRTTLLQISDPVFEVYDELLASINREKRKLLRASPPETGHQPDSAHYTHPLDDEENSDNQLFEILEKIGAKRAQLDLVCSPQIGSHVESTYLTATIALAITHKHFYWNRSDFTTSEKLAEMASRRRAKLEDLEKEAHRSRKEFIRLLRVELDLPGDHTVNSPNDELQNAYPDRRPNRGTT